MGRKYAKLHDTNHHIRDSIAGFSLVELMVSLAIAGFLGIGLWGLMQTQNKTYGQQDNTSQMQQNLRAAVNKVSSDLLSAQGPKTAVAGVAWYVAAADGVTWKPYSIAVNKLDILGCTNGVVGITLNTVNAGNTVITLDTVNGASAGSFTVNSYVSIGGLELAKVTNVGANTITVGAGLTNTYSPGAEIRPLQWITYQIQNNTLTRDPNDGSGAQVIANFVVPQAQPWVQEISQPNYKAIPPDGGVLQITINGLKPGYNAPGSTVTNTIHLRNV